MLIREMGNVETFIYNTIAEGKIARTTDDLQKLIGFQTSIIEIVKQALLG
jgi:NAD(P)H dehydrogenase (quinone)